MIGLFDKMCSNGGAYLQKIATADNTPECFDKELPGSAEKTRLSISIRQNYATADTHKMFVIIK